MNGFIVTRVCERLNPLGWPCALKGGLLLASGYEVTVFATRSLAYSAVKRTKRRAEKQRLPWAGDKFRVQRVKEAQ